MAWLETSELDFNDTIQRLLELSEEAQTFRVRPIASLPWRYSRSRCYIFTLKKELQVIGIVAQDKRQAILQEMK